jgi:argininosuccinate lyase
MKLWQKNTEVNKKIEEFTVGNDCELDLMMAEFDVLGSMAHTRMLNSIGLIANDEIEIIQAELKAIYAQIKSGNFSIEAGIEDIHSQVELLLTRKIGDFGKKIHSGRSRNDQVLVDIKMFLRSQIAETVKNVQYLFELLQQLSEKYKNELLPGYTHFQIAMPSSFGMWFGAYAESLVDDLEQLLAAYRISNKNPLGSAAGYGASFPLNRTMTTQLLGFETLNYNAVYAQMSRGKTEKAVANGIAAVAATLSKLAYDVCLYMNQNFGFITFPENLTTGSSIMPHKKNPDVFELIRAKCNRLQALPNELALLVSNLPSGYHRDMQLTKDCIFPAFQVINDCLQMTAYMLDNIKVTPNILENPKYDLLFSVEAVNQMVVEGTPFRDAYKKVGLQIAEGNFTKPAKVPYSHEGSIGKLCNTEIKSMMDEVLERFQFGKVDEKLNQLVS